MWADYNTVSGIKGISRDYYVDNSGAHFSVSNAECEGVGDGHGHSERTLLVK